MSAFRYAAASIAWSNLCRSVLNGNRDDQAVGCIGILSDWVVETAATLCRAGEIELTFEALAKHALKHEHRFDAPIDNYKITMLQCIS